MHVVREERHSMTWAVTVSSTEDSGAKQHPLNNFGHSNVSDVTPTCERDCASTTHRQTVPERPLAGESQSDGLSSGLCVLIRLLRDVLVTTVYGSPPLLRQLLVTKVACLVMFVCMFPLTPVARKMPSNPRHPVLITCASTLNFTFMSNTGLFAPIRRTKSMTSSPLTVISCCVVVR